MNAPVEKPALAPVAARLGLTQGRGRRYGPCPSCSASRLADGRPPIRVFAGGKQWWCNACDAHGDAFDLVRAAQGCDFRQARAFIEGDEQLAQIEVEPVKELPPPPFEQVRRLVRKSTRAHEDEAVAAYLRSRGVEPHRAPAFAIPTRYQSDWWRPGWSQIWRLGAPLVDGRARLVSIEARALEPRPEGAPKTRKPYQCSSSGLLFANKAARDMMRDACDPSALWVGEGITDYLAIAARAEPHEAVIGMISGSGRAIAEMRIPRSVPVYVWTDHDETGDRYAATFRQYTPHHDVYRMRPPAA